VLELAADRQPPRDAAHLDAFRAQELADVMRGGFAFDSEVRREDRFTYDAVTGALHQPVEVDFTRTDAVERRKRAHQHEIESLVALRLLHHEQIGGRFDHAQERCIATR
jgi:hypothetical protein